MTRPSALALLLGLGLPLLPSPAGAAATYRFADLGPTPWIGTSATSYMLSHSRRPRLDESGQMTFAESPQSIDRSSAGVTVSAFAAPYAPQYGGLFAEVPGTAARVGYVAGPSSMAPWQAAYWNASTGRGQALGGTLPPGGYSIATDVNRAGQIVGYGGGAGAGHTRPAAWTADGAAWDPFAGLSGADWGESAGAYGLNDAGEIVGRFRAAWNYSDSDRPRAFLLSGGRLADLNDLVALEAGWLLEAATDINNLGQITGIARDPSGALRGFLLTPGAPVPVPDPVPEPATLATLAAGLAAVVWRRKRR
jgi:hypothetical protein